MRRKQLLAIGLGAGIIAIAGLMATRARILVRINDPRVPDSSKVAVHADGETRPHDSPYRSSSTGESMNPLCLIASLRELGLSVSPPELRELLKRRDLARKLLLLERALLVDTAAIRILDEEVQREECGVVRGLLFLAAGGRPEIEARRLTALIRDQDLFAKLCAFYSQLLAGPGSAESDENGVERWMLRLSSLDEDVVPLIEGRTTLFGGPYKIFPEELRAQLNVGAASSPAFMAAWAELARSSRGNTKAVWLSWVNMLPSLPSDMKKLVEEVAAQGDSAYAVEAACLILARTGDAGCRSYVLRIAQDALQPIHARIRAVRALAATSTDGDLNFVADLWRELQANLEQGDAMRLHKLELSCSVLAVPELPWPWDLAFRLPSTHSRYVPARDLLLQWLGEERDRQTLRQLAQALLTRLDNPDHLVGLLLRHSSRDVRATVIEGIMELEMAQYASLLSTVAMHDPDPEVRSVASRVSKALSGEDPPR